MDCISQNHFTHLWRFPSGIPHFFGHMRRGIIAAHAECGLQKADDGSVGPTEPSLVDEVREDKGWRLQVVIAGEDCDHNDQEGADVPDE